MMRRVLILGPATLWLLLFVRGGESACPGGGNCSGHGTCIAIANACACFTGYGGIACDQCATDYYGYPTCFHCVASSDCNGHGACTDSGCTCTPPYVGTNCQYVCSAACATCSSNGSCATCLPGYWGTSCSPCPGGASNPCNVNTGNGTCDQGIFGSGVCNCNPGYCGNACQYSRAGYCNNHGNPDCVGECNCDAGWTGTTCGTPAVPSVVQWRSMRTQAGGGELGIVLNPTAAGDGPTGPTVETRAGGIQKILVDFDRSVTLVDSTGVAVVGHNSGGSANYAPAVSMVDADTMQLVFAPGFMPDQTCYTITIASSTFLEGLTGDNNVKVRSLVGDVTMNGTVTLSDAVLVALRAATSVTATASPASDVTVSGTSITMADALAAKAQVASPPHRALCP